MTILGVSEPLQYAASLVLLLSGALLVLTASSVSRRLSPRLFSLCSSDGPEPRSPALYLLAALLGVCGTALLLGPLVFFAEQQGAERWRLLLAYPIPASAGIIMTTAASGLVARLNDHWDRPILRRYLGVVPPSDWYRQFSTDALRLNGVIVALSGVFFLATLLDKVVPGPAALTPLAISLAQVLGGLFLLFAKPPRPGSALDKYQMDRHILNTTRLVKMRPGYDRAEAVRNLNTFAYRLCGAALVLTGITWPWISR